MDGHRPAAAQGDDLARAGIDGRLPRQHDQQAPKDDQRAEGQPRPQSGLLNGE